MPHPEDTIDPARDVRTLQSELLLADLVAVEKRIERLREEAGKKGGTVRCGTFVIGTVNGTYCGFSDKSVGGILVSYDLAKPADAAALTDRVRQQIEK